MKAKAQAVKGLIIRKPRLTAAGYGLIVTRIIVPFLGILALCDALLYLVMRYGFDRCYGILCFF